MTSSRIGPVCGFGPKTARAMLKELGTELSSYARQMCDWGSTNEENARRAFAAVLQAGGLGDQWKDAEFERPGLLVDAQHPWAAGSPDTPASLQHRRPCRRFRGGTPLLSRAQ